MFTRPVYLALFASLLASGCKSTGVDAAEETSGALRATHKALEAAPAKIDAVTADLAELKKPDIDMAKVFSQYSADLAALQSHRSHVSSLRQRLESDRTAFNAQWQKRLESIQNEELRDLADARREALAEEFKKIAEAGAPARDGMEPWMQSLQDLKGYLEFNLNPEGVTAVAGRIDTAIEAAAPIETSIQSVLGMMTDLADRIEAAKPPPPPAEQPAGSGA